MVIHFKKTVLFLLFILFASISIACSPMYFTSSDRTIVEIEGTEYLSSNTSWSLLLPHKKAGYVNNGHTYLYESAKFKERLFVSIKEEGGEYYPQLYYRSDIEIPEFSYENVDSVEWIGWKELENIENDNFTYGTNTIRDRDAIKEIFDVLYDKDRIITKWPQNFKDHFFGCLYFYNDDLPGLGYILSFTGQPDNFYVISDFVGNEIGKYISFPTDLINKIAGTDIGEGLEQTS